MGMNSNALLVVKAFDMETREKVLAIDISEYELEGWEEEGDHEIYCYEKYLAYGSNNFDDLMEEIGNALGKNGKAYLVELCMEDVPEGTVYFYLGDKVRYRNFSEDDFEMTEEWPDCEDKIFVPSLKWDPSYVLRGNKRENFSKDEIRILKKKM